MINSLLHKISAVSLALLVMFSTLSFTVEKHFCGDFLVDIAVFSNLEKCGGETSQNEQGTTIKKPCCKDTVELIEGQDELHKLSFEDLDLEHQQFIKAFVVSYINLFEGLQQLYVPHKAYSPPNIVEDIQELDEVYLI